MKSSEIAIEIAIEISPFRRVFLRAFNAGPGGCAAASNGCRVAARHGGGDAVGRDRHRRAAQLSSAEAAEAGCLSCCWLLVGKSEKHVKNLRMLKNMLKNMIEEWCEDFYKISIIAMIAIILSTCCLILLLLNVLGLYTLPLSSIEPHSCIFNLPTLGEIWKSRSNKAPQPCLKVCVPQDSR